LKPSTGNTLPNFGEINSISSRSELRPTWGCLPVHIFELGTAPADLFDSLPQTVLSQEPHIPGEVFVLTGQRQTMSSKKIPKALGLVCCFNRSLIELSFTDISLKDSPYRDLFKARSKMPWRFQAPPAQDRSSKLPFAAAQVPTCPDFENFRQPEVVGISRNNRKIVIVARSHGSWLRAGLRTSWCTKLAEGSEPQTHSLIKPANQPTVNPPPPAAELAASGNFRQSPGWRANTTRHMAQRPAQILEGPPHLRAGGAGNLPSSIACKAIRFTWSGKRCKGNVGQGRPPAGVVR